MSKKWWLIFVVLIFSSIVYSDDTYRHIGDKITVDKKVIEIIDISSKDVYLSINGVVGRVFVNTTKMINGVNITVNDIFYHVDYKGRLVLMDYSVVYKDLCMKDEECDDEDACTIDRCTGVPGSCSNPDSHPRVKECKSFDGCCPGECRYPEDLDCSYGCQENDDCTEDRNPCTFVNCTSNKCTFWPVIKCESSDECCPEGCAHSINIDMDCSEANECVYSWSCDDNNTCTIDECTGERGNQIGEIKKCRYKSILECKGGDKCCPLNCEDKDADCKEGSCYINEDCDDKNVCTNDACSNYTCKNELKGCLHSNECLGFGSTRENKYCGNDGNWLEQKSGKVGCKNDSECLSGKCINEECKDTLRSKLYYWLKKIFL